MGNVMFMRKGEVHTAPVGGLPVSSLVEGQIVMINEGGVAVPFYLAKHDYESGLNGAGRVLMVRKEAHSAVAYETAPGGGTSFINSDLRTWLNGDYKASLDTKVQELIGETSYYYGVGPYTYQTSSPVFTLALMEFGISYTYGTKEGTALPIAEILKIATFNGSSVIQHTRSGHYDPSTNSYTSTYNCAVMANGQPTYGNTSNKHYARPCFTLPSDVLTEVNEDGTVTLKV